MVIEGLFDAPGLTKSKLYKVIKVDEINNIWTRRYFIIDDNNETVWCYDDEVIEIIL